MKAVDLAYEEFGSQNAAPLVILHGFFASSRNWRRIGEQLATKFHVYILDMRNHGNSPRNQEMDYPVMSGDVLHFINRHALSDAHLLGHSMGGKIAMWLALNHPESIKKLVVVDIAPKNYQHSFDKIINALIDLPLGEISNRKQAEDLLSSAIPELHYRQFLLQNLTLTAGHYGWRIDLEQFKSAGPSIAGFPKTQNLPAYAGEVLFIAGSLSGYVTPEDFAELFPGALYQSIEGAGHWPHVQKPEEFIEMVENFL
jgi:esterase